MKIKQIILLGGLLAILSAIVACSFVQTFADTDLPATTVPETAVNEASTDTASTGSATSDTASTGSASTLSFPRLGMWWPNPWGQSLDDIARYDWVVFFPDMEEFILPIKAINPDIILLNATNACELWYDSSPHAEPEDNAHILDIPPQWFLTQVGTTLTEDVDLTSTTFHVDEISVSDGEEDIQLFVEGETVLIDGETVIVEAVDEAAKILTVERGFVRPAAAHSAGTRIAAHITFWPDTWLLNLSTMSPLGTTDPAIGPERWADYNARVAAGLLSNPDWDGILLDRADPDQSWLIGGSTARTIDPDQSNRLLTDYADFDQAWNEGLRQYESQLRQEVGDEKIIFVNWGMDNFDLLNGNNYEGFPLDDGRSYRASWRQTVFGNVPNIGSYAQWMEQGRQPNLTMIETYEDDGGPDPAGDGSYDNPCDDPGFEPNYQKMRFGLTTALLNDGYFSYEINTNGHGYLCLLWFDEYDNAGQGRGYLGQPLGAAFRVGDSALGDNLLSGGDFETEADLDAWGLWADDGYAAAVGLDGGTAVSINSSGRIDISQTQGTDWQISLSFEPLDIVSGTEYTLFFWAKADRARSLSSWAQQARSPWEGYLEFGSVSLTPEWQQFEVVATATNSDAGAVFNFGLGETTGSVWLDDVRLQTGNQDVWRRDYEGGSILVNATGTPHKVDLNGTLRKINGGQAPQINDGSMVTEVDLPSKDGLILLIDETAVYLPNVVKSIVVLSGPQTGRS